MQVAATDDLAYVFAIGQRTVGKKTVCQTSCFRNLDGKPSIYGTWAAVRIAISSLGPVFYGAKQKEVIKVDFSTKKELLRIDVSLVDEADTCTAITLSRDENFMFVGVSDNSIRIYLTETGQEVGMLLTKAAPRYLFHCDNNRTLYTVSESRIGAIPLKG